jgi:hypothetical protein
VALGATGDDVLGCTGGLEQGEAAGQSNGGSRNGIKRREVVRADSRGRYPRGEAPVHKGVGSN